MCIVIFSTTCVKNPSHSKKNSARYYRECALVSMYSTRYSYQILMALAFSSQNFENPQISNFIISVQWEPNCSMQMDGQTDGQA